MKQHKPQVNQYDKIFRENMEAVLPGIIKHLLKLNIVESEELPDDLQYTKERKPDLLKKVRDAANNTYVLHIEYQVKNEAGMVYRMAEYSVMLQRRYRLPIKQYVVFIGSAKPKMITIIETEDLYFRYNLIALSSVDYKIFLRSEKPEEKILAIMANFADDSPVDAIVTILKEVKSVSEGDLSENRYFNQLRVLVQLRKLENHFDIAMETITKFFKEERDPLFRRGEARGKAEGEARGEEKKSYEIVANMISAKRFTIDEIAYYAQVSIEFVQKVRAELNKKDKK